MKKCPICKLNNIHDHLLVCNDCRNLHNATTLVQSTIKIQTTKDNTVSLVYLKSKLLNLLKTFGFEGFLHTTNINNFINIYKRGFLFSRAYLTNHNLDFQDNAEKDIIDKTYTNIKEKVRFYYRPMTPTNISAYLYHNQRNPVILVFDENIIYHNNVYFTDGCAKSYETTITHIIKEALSFDWRSIFDNTPLYEADNTAAKRKRNAEFLYPIKIGTDKIKKVYFKTQKDLNYAMSILGYNPKFELNPSKFYGG